MRAIDNLRKPLWKYANRVAVSSLDGNSIPMEIKFSAVNLIDYEENNQEYSGRIG